MDKDRRLAERIKKYSGRKYRGWFKTAEEIKVYAEATLRADDEVDARYAARKR